MRQPPDSPSRLFLPLRIMRRAVRLFLQALAAPLTAPGPQGRIVRTRLLSLALVSLLVLPTLPVWGLFTPAPQLSRAVSAAAAPIPPGPPVTTPAYNGKPAPSLSIHVTVAPDPVEVGKPATATLTVRNEGATDATNLIVTLPAPVGVEPQAGPGLVSPTAGWKWTQPQLAAHGETTFTATVLAATLPPSQALLLKPTGISQELTAPVTGTGGAVIVGVPATVATTQAVAAHTDAALRSTDARVEVALPAAASADALTVTYTTTPGPGESKPTVPATLRHDLGVFYLNATNGAGQAVHQLAAPYSLTVHYTPEQIEALNLNASALTLFWYDPNGTPLSRGASVKGRWVPLPTKLDSVAHTASTTVDHFSMYNLGDPSSVTDVFRPTLQGFQVNTFTGAASYEVPIAVPAGPGGVKPNLSLHYDSNQTDGEFGQQRMQPASWVGKGWSLDTGAISLDLFNLYDPYEYTMVLGGKSYRLFGAANGTTDPSTDHDPTHRTWHTADESFLKVTVEGNGDSTYTYGDLNSRGFFDGDGNRMNPTFTPRHRYKWHVWTKDGTQYDFEEDLWQGFDDCLAPNFVGGYHDAMTYSWKLTHVTDTHGNTITYTYHRDSDQASNSGACGYLEGTADHDAWPTSITWGQNANGPSADRYRVLFYTSNDPNQAGRSYDTAYGQFTIQYGHSPHVVTQLNYIDVQSKPDVGDYGLVARYQMNYTAMDTAMLSDYANSSTHMPDTTDKRLTLHNVCRFGNNGDAAPTPTSNNGAALPCTVFSYGNATNDRGTGTYPNGEWNRLTKVDNGYTGTVSIAYDDIGMVVDSPSNYGGVYQGTDYVTKKEFANFRRVTSRTLGDGRGHQDQWMYSYGRPELNANDTIINSAELYLDQHYGTTPNHDPIYQYDTVAQSHKEFRGHATMTEKDPLGRQTTHSFYQGDLTDKGEATCTLVATGSTASSYDMDPCFAQLHLNGILKGREYKTEVLDSGGGLNTRTEHNFPASISDVQFVDLGVDPYTGVWHAWAPERSTVTSTFEGGTAGPQRTMTYTYDSAAQGGTQYGNLTAMDECVGGSCPGTSRLRHTDTTYVANASGGTSTGPYLVNRATQVKVSDSSGKVVKLTRQFYDSLATGVGAKGELTKMNGFADAVTPQNSSDAVYSYDAWGNKASTTTYRGYNGTMPRVTTVAYDSKHTHPASVSYPLGLSESATYDPVMDTLRSVTDENGQITMATYDPFGRLATTKKPLEPNPYSLQVTYRDGANPPNVTVAQSDATSNRPVTTFFDGRGRTIQTKGESAENTQTITTDNQYDGMGNLTQTSQAHYVSESTGTGAPPYSDPMGTLTNPTITDYDAFGRVKKVTAPSNPMGPTITTQTSYGISGSRRTATVTDANGHQTTQATDVFGRLTTVGEVYGGGAPTQTTTYAYSALDQLLTATDAQTHVTTYTYDDLGRTTAVTDPDLGLTTSTYDAAGNLTQTTDANVKVIGIGYDDLDRMIAKQFDGGMTNYTYDAIAGGNFGKGRLTSKSRPTIATTTQYTYDARGRKVGTTETIQGVVATFAMGYDSADNPTSMTYPAAAGTMTGETVTTSYDAAERATQAQSSLGATNYATGVSYTALGKLAGITLGNGVGEAFTYESGTQRLGQHQIGTAGALFNRTYHYDNVGNVTTITGDAASGPQSFTYDERDRLTTATATAPAPYSESDGYDAVGNLTTKGGVAYSYPGHTPSNRALPHAPAQAVGGAYTYDEVGNTLTGNGRTLTWNSQNLPVTIAGGITTGGGGTPTPTPTPVPPATPTPPPVPSATPSGTARACGTAAAGMAPNLSANRGGATVAGGPNLAANRGGATVAGAPNLTANRGCTTGAMGGGLQPHGVTPGTETYTYDAEGARVSRQTVAGMTTLTTLYFGGLWEVEKETGATRAFYTLGGSTVAQRTRPGGMGTGTLVYLHGDHLGSAALITDSTGAKVSGEEYGAWGQVRSGDNSATTPLDFTGQHKDGTGLLYYGARYYDTALGRFLSADTVSGSKGDPQSLNPYSYVRNNPVNATDPTGHCVEVDGSGGCTSGGGYNAPISQLPLYPPYSGTPPGGYGGNGGCQNPSYAAQCAAPTYPATPMPTATGTPMPYATPTANPTCGTASANFSCAQATATMYPPTATSTPGGYYTAQPYGPPVPYPQNVVVDDHGQLHIIEGEVYSGNSAIGGGHGPGRNVPGKSEFPSNLTDDEIVAGVRTIANDPNSMRMLQGLSRYVVQGSIYGANNTTGQSTTVVVDASRGRVITAFPNGIPRNPPSSVPTFPLQIWIGT